MLVRSTRSICAAKLRQSISFPVSQVHQDHQCSRGIHFIRSSLTLTNLNLSIFDGITVGDAELVKACAHGEEAIGRKPTFRVAILPDDVTVLPTLAVASTTINESAPPLLAFSSKMSETVRGRKETEGNKSHSSTVMIDSVYMDASVQAKPFFSEKPVFPSHFGGLSAREIISDPPKGVFFITDPDFDGNEMLTRLSILLDSDCHILGSPAGTSALSQPYIYPNRLSLSMQSDMRSGSETANVEVASSEIGESKIPVSSHQEEREESVSRSGVMHGTMSYIRNLDKHKNADFSSAKKPPKGATGVALFGEVTGDDIAELTKRICGPAALKCRMSESVQRTLFVPRREAVAEEHIEGGMVINSLPIFQPGELLFPGALLTSNVFEPRYKLMIKEHLRTGKPFGVKLTSSDVGCLACVDSVSEVDPVSGESKLLIRGLSRFRVLDESGEVRADAKVPSSLQTAPFSFGLKVADVQVFEDDGCEIDHSAEPVKDLIGEAQKYLQEEDPSFDSTEASVSIEELSFLSAFMTTNSLPASHRQRWLEMKDSYIRLNEVLSIIRGRHSGESNSDK